MASFSSLYGTVLYITITCTESNLFRVRVVRFKILVALAFAFGEYLLSELHHDPSYVLYAGVLCL